MAGTLSGTIAIGQATSSQYAGGSALTAATLEKYALAAGLTGAGALDVASALARFDRSAALTGSGLYMPMTKQNYALAANLTAAGALSAGVGLPLMAAFSGVGALSADARIGITVVAHSGAADTLDRADSTVSAGPDWTNRRQSIGIINGAAYAANVPNLHCVASHKTLMAADDMDVSIVLGPMTGATPNSYASILLGANDTGQCFFAFVSNNDIVIYSQTANPGWINSPTARVTVAGVGFTTGDKVTFRRVGNVYRVRKNDVDIAGATYTDSGNLVPRDDDHRYVGMGCFNPLSDMPGGRTIDSFDARALPDNDTVKFGSGGALVATAVNPAVPFTEENINRTNQARPLGLGAAWITLIGAGGRGGDGQGTSSGSHGGGGGGGGGAKIPRIYVPASAMGSTYSVSRGTNTGTNGNPSTFTSGSLSLSAGGGVRGVNGTTSGGGAGGGGGTATASGITGVTLQNGTAGGNGGVSSTAGTAAPDNATGSAAGGGGGGGSSDFFQSDGGKGGNSATVTGGAKGVAGSGSASRGTSALDATAGNAGAGGGGAGGSDILASEDGGVGGLYGGGGGGGGGNDGPDFGSGGHGGDGYVKVEWVLAAVYTDDFNRANSTTTLGANWTTRLSTLGISSNEAYAPTTNTTGMASYNTPLGTDDMSVSYVVGINAVAASGGLILGANTAGEAVGLTVNYGAGSLQLFRQSTWAGAGTNVGTAVSSGSGVVETDTVTLRRVGNVYTVLRNGVATACTWTDSSNVVPRNSSHRLVGLYAVNSSGFAPGINSWSANEL